MLIKLDRASQKKNIRGHIFVHMREGDESAFSELTDVDMEEAAVKKKIMELEEQIQTAHESGYQAGLQEGERAGFSQAQEKLQAHTENFANLLESLNVQQNEIITSAEDFVVHFALGVAEKIIGGVEFEKMQIDEAKLMEIIEQGLNSFPDSTKYEMRVHKQTAKTLEKHRAEILEQMGGQTAISIVEDPSLRPGDCLFESNFGVLDARIESQFDEIKNYFKVGTNQKSHE